MNGSRPSDARERVLAKLPPEKRLEVLERSDKRGPRPNDPDWLLVEAVIGAVEDVKVASSAAVKSIEAAVPLGPAALAAIEAAVAKGNKSRAIVGTVVWSPLRSIITFVVAGLAYAAIGAYAAHFARLVSVSFVATGAFVAGVGFTTAYYEYVRRY